jgi:hypothetical protein
MKNGLRNYYNCELSKLLSFIIPKNVSLSVLGFSISDIVRNNNNNVIKSVIDLSQSKEEINSLSRESVADLVDNDYLLMIDVVGKMDDVQETLTLVNKGDSEKRIVITYYNQLWEPIIQLAEKFGLKSKQRIQNWLSVQDLENLLYLSNFEVIKKGSFLLCPFYFPLVSHICNRYLAHLPIIRKLCLVYYLIVRPRPVCQLENSKVLVSVVVPTRNEKGNIEEIVRTLPELGLGTEIIFVDGHSTDGTLTEIERVKCLFPNRNIKILFQDGKGKGDAVRKGFDTATGEILMIFDADITVPPEDLRKFYGIITSLKADFVNGTRLVYPLADQSMRILNMFGNKFFSLMFSWLLDQRLKDTLCGTKVLSKKNYEKIKNNRNFFGDFDPFGDFDLIFGAAKLNLKIVDLPIRYKARKYGTTNISRFSHGWLLLKMCFFAMRKIKFI